MRQTLSPEEDETARAEEVLSAAEERFEGYRRASGFVLAPLLFLVVQFAPLPLPAVSHKLAAVLTAVMVLWITESLPIPVTALLGPTLCVLLGIAPAKQIFAPFADPLIFLFIGSFILAQAIFTHRLNERFAYAVMSVDWVGSNPARILLAYGAACTFLSFWMSNTATTALFFPMGLSLLAFMDSVPGLKIRPQYGSGLMLMTAFGPSIGGMATPVGTPPNIIGIGLIARFTGYRISFFQWMLIGIPIVVLLFGFTYLQFYLRSGAGVREITGSGELLARRKKELGAWTRAQKNVVIAFCATLILWILPGIVAVVVGAEHPTARAINNRVPEGVAALAGSLLLFLLPVDWKAKRFTLTWSEAVRIDWGVVLLYGAGLALGDLAFQTGLAQDVGTGLARLFPWHNLFFMILLFTSVGVIVSETTSNTTSASMIIPIALSVSKSAGVNSVLPALAATLGCSMGFMLPVSTAPNAIVYGSGKVPILNMVKYGFALDVAGIVVISAVVYLLGQLVLF